MTNVIIEVSKYVLIFLMAVYTYLNFSYFRFHDVWEQNRTCARQNVMMFFIHLIAYAILFLKSKDERVVLFCLFYRLYRAVPAVLSQHVPDSCQQYVYVALCRLYHADASLI